MFQTVRGRAFLKFALLLLLFFVLRFLVATLVGPDDRAFRKLNALPLMPIFLAPFPFLELIMGAPFSELSTRWNGLSWWQQWGIVLHSPVTILAVFSAIGALLYQEP